MIPRLTTYDSSRRQDFSVFLFPYHNHHSVYRRHRYGFQRLHHPIPNTNQVSPSTSTLPPCVVTDFNRAPHYKNITNPPWQPSISKIFRNLPTNANIICTTLINLCWGTTGRRWSCGIGRLCGRSCTCRGNFGGDSCYDDGGGGWMRGGSCNGGCGDDRGLGEARAGVNGGGVVTNSLLALLVLAKDVIEKCSILVH
jgi:hypothetical protein